MPKPITNIVKHKTAIREALRVPNMTKIIKPKAFAVFLVLFIQTREKSELMDSSYNLIKSLNPSYRLLLCSILATKQSWPSHETSKNSKTATDHSKDSPSWHIFS